MQNCLKGQISSHFRTILLISGGLARETKSGFGHFGGRDEIRGVSGILAHGIPFKRGFEGQAQSTSSKLFPREMTKASYAKLLEGPNQFALPNHSPHQRGPGPGDEIRFWTLRRKRRNSGSQRHSCSWNSFQTWV